jgi:hypothetical protein
MKKKCSLFVMAMILVFTLAPTLAFAEEPIFFEGFENGISGWELKKATNGDPVTSTDKKKSGNNSYSVNVKGEDFLFKQLPTKQNAVATIWFYDDVNIKEPIAFASVDDGKFVGLGLYAPESQSHYIVRVGPAFEVTTVERSTGWHELKWDYTSGTKVDMYIDGKLVKTAEKPSFDIIRVGSPWAILSSGQLYFDDIKVVKQEEVAPAPAAEQAAKPAAEPEVSKSDSANSQTAAPAVNNPKTGDSGVLPYLFLIGSSILGFVIYTRKKFAAKG